MCALDQQVKKYVWEELPAFEAPQEPESEWEHAACCAEAHEPRAAQDARPQPVDPDEWWPESCVA